MSRLAEGNDAKMRKTILGLVAPTALAVGSAANATITVDGSSMSYTGPSTLGLDTTIGYSKAGLGKPTFTQWLEFTNTLAGIYSITLDTSSRSVNFTSAFLSDGVNSYALTCQVGCVSGTSEFWNMDDTLIAAGDYTLWVNGTNSRTGSLAGTITVTQALPEPGTWAMMIMGFGAMGWQLRRRRSSLALTQAA